MIPRKDQFSGDLGKTRFFGGSRYLTVPDTIAFDPKAYGVAMSFDASIEILCCSLNGMLWLLGYEEADGRKFFMAVPMGWNPAAGEVAPIVDHVVTQARAIPHILDGQQQAMIDEPVARGLDWVMTKKWIFKVLPDEPYIRASVHSWMFNVDLRGRYISYSLHRHKDVNYYVTTAGHEVGGGINPFTGQRMLGTVPMQNALPYTSVRPRFAEDCCCILPPFDDWSIMEDFLVRIPARWQDYYPGSQSNALGISPVYHGVYWTIRPLIPLEFNWSGDDRYPSHGVAGDIRGIQIAVSQGKLYAKGLLYMGDALVLPAAFDELGEPAEYFLAILNSHGYKSAYDPLSTELLTYDPAWLSMTPMLLKDSVDAGASVLSGHSTKPDDPRTGSICRIPEDGAVLLPSGWYRPRDDDENRTVYDPTDRLCLTLGKKGATFFCAKSENGSAVVLDDYTCHTISPWLAPADQVESLSPRTVVGSFDHGAVVTNIEGYFSRVYLSHRLLPLTWGVFEKKQNPDDPDEVTARVRLSFGKREKRTETPDGTVTESTEITFAEIKAEDEVVTSHKDNVPFDTVFRNPFSLRLLRHDETPIYRAFWWTLAEAGYTDPDLPQIFLDTNPAVPCVPLVYRNIAGGLVQFAWVDPETGGLTPASFDFGSDYEVKYFPLLDTSGPVPVLKAKIRNVDTGAIREEAVNVPLPAWLTDEGDWLRVGNPVMDAQNRVPGLRPIPVPMSYPSLGTLDYYGGESATRGTGPWGISGLIKLRESSSNLLILWKNCAFGYRLDSGSSYTSHGLVILTDNGNDPAARERLLRVRDWSEHGAGHYGAFPVTDCLGRTKYLKTLTIWGTSYERSIPVARGGSLGQWEQNHIYVMRTDLDNAAFDFDAEMLRVRR